MASTALKFLMSVKRRVTLTMSAGVQPAAFSTASLLDNMRRVCASRPSSSSPVSGSRPVCPVRKTRSPVRIACECVPIDGGAAFVAILVLFDIRVSRISVRQDYRIKQDVQDLFCQRFYLGPEPVALCSGAEFLIPQR